MPHSCCTPAAKNRNEVDPRVAKIVADSIGIDTHHHIDIPLGPRTKLTLSSIPPGDGSDRSGGHNNQLLRFGARTNLFWKISTAALILRLWMPC